MVLGQVGWHGARALRTTGNVTLVPLPPYTPELNLVERVWLYLHQRFLMRRLLDDYDAIFDACCDARNKLTPECFRSLCSYPASGRSTAKLSGVNPHHPWFRPQVPRTDPQRCRIEQKPFFCRRLL